MTIPIRPGPFSFLAGAGQAVGAVGEALVAKRERERVQALQNAGLLMQLISGPNAVLDPTTVAPQVVGSLGRLGIPGVTPQAIVQNPAVERSKRVGALPEGTRKDIALDVPTVAAGKVDEAAGAKADVAIKALQGLSLEQIRNLQGVLPPEVAKLAERVTFEKMQTELLAQDNNRLEDEVQATIRKDVLARLPKDPQFRRIADFAAVGGLGYLIAGLQESGASARLAGQLNTEKLRAITTLTTQAGQAYRQELNDWTEKRNAAIANAELTLDPEDRGTEDYIKAVNSAVADFDSKFPKPDLANFTNSLLEQAGITKEDYQQAFGSLINASSKGGTTSSSSTSSKGVSDAQFNQIKALYQQGRFTADDVNNSESLSPDQKKQILAGKK